MTIDAPSFCWHCRGDLKPGRDGLVFGTVRDPLGNDHRVHLVCMQDAVGDGYEEVQPEIASRETTKGQP